MGAKEPRRRNRSKLERRQIVEESLKPGASVATVARVHGVRAKTKSSIGGSSIATDDLRSHLLNYCECMLPRPNRTPAASTSSSGKCASAWKAAWTGRVCASSWSTPHDDLVACRYDDLDRRRRHRPAARVHR